MISIDELIQFAMDSKMQFSSDKDELLYLKNTRPIIRDELLTCYQFLKDQGLYEKYIEYRG